MATSKRRAFEFLTDSPCPLCLELAVTGVIQARAVMPLPVFPARARHSNSKCCRDCQAAETLMDSRIGGHPSFGPSRVTVANDRCEGLVSPVGLMEHRGLCKMGFIEPCSVDDLESHAAWLEGLGIPDSTSTNPFEVCIPAKRDQ